MFESRYRGGGSSANRWLIVAGAGLVILAFVARMLLDIGHTKVSDLAAVIRPDTAGATQTAVPETASPPVPAADTTAAALPPGTTVVATPPPVLKPDTTATPAPKPVPAPPAKPVTAPAAAPASTGGAYAVQIGAFGSEANATKLVERSAALGYRASVIPQARGATTLYLVQVTGLAGAADARQAADSLQRTLGVKAVVVRPGR